MSEKLQVEAVCDCGEIRLYPIGRYGKTDYGHTMPWPEDWPQSQLVSEEWLRRRCKRVVVI